MIRAMMSGVTGLRTHATGMDVIGNDVANVNTPGFKQSDVTFRETLVQSLRTPAVGSPGQQIGLGTQIGGITRNFGGGALVQTDQEAHMGISGDGFYVVADPGAAADDVYYTRAGDFLRDFNPNTGETFLINPGGKRLLGVLDPNPDATNLLAANLVPIVLPQNTDAFSVGLNGIVTASVNGVEQTVGMVPVARFSNNTGLNSIGNNLYRGTAAANALPFTNPGADGAGQIFQGYLENSNVDLAREFTEMILTQRGFQANSRTITTSDEMLQEVLTLKR